MTTHWKTHFWRNTATNYLRVGVRMVTGLVMFRMLFQYLTEEQFGYWALLWSVFGYTILMDFGLGLAAQREAAYRSTTGEWKELSRLLSTMVWSFMALGCAILLFFVIIKPYFMTWIHVSDVNHNSFSTAYWFFFVALAISFPLGIFPEMLAGLQRLDLANWTQIVSSLVNTAAIFLAVKFRWSLETIVLMSVVTASLGPNIINYFMVRHMMPELSLNPKLFHFDSVKSILAFSLSAYVIILTNLIATRTDQIVISMTLGVALVAVYQAGYKVSEMFGMLTHQIQRALSPAAAHLRAKKDQSALRELVMQSTRLTTLFSVPCYVFSAVYLDSLIRLLTGLKEVGDAAYWVGQVMLLNTIFYLITTSCSRRILLMTGLEKSLLKASVVNAVVNLALSIILVFKLGVVGVVIGTLIPGVLIGCLWTLHLTLNAVQLSLGEWCRHVYGPVMIPAALSLGVLAALVWFWPVSFENVPLLTLLINGILVMLPTGIYALVYRAKFA